MSPPRRSSRLRGGTAVSSSQQKSFVPNTLTSVAEREEQFPSKRQLFPDANAPSRPHTPLTAPRPKPSLEEMHPSKVHQSTAEHPDLGLQFGFANLHPKPGEPTGALQHTPSKLRVSSPDFEFKFSRPGPQLGPAAQQMMNELREEALRIKAKMAAEHETKRMVDNTAENSTASGVRERKIAQPKGKAGRFSDIHMAEFRKMDSIAGHPSSFRAPPGRAAESIGKLKRSQSKARLEEKDEPKLEMDMDFERLENKAPAKRARQHISDDISFARPISRDKTQDSLPSTPHPARVKAPLLSSITTPTQASLARAVNSSTASQIPTLTRSNSTITLYATTKGYAKPSTTNKLSGVPKSEPRGFLRSPRLERVKSMFRHPSASMKKFSAKQSSLPLLTENLTKPNVEKSLPQLLTPSVEINRSDSVRRVKFVAADLTSRADSNQSLSSPMKLGLPRSTSKLNVGAYHLSKVDKESATHEVQYPSISSRFASSPSVEYPSLKGLVDHLQNRPPPSVPSTFTFRSDHTIDFGHSPKGFGSSPGQASVRQVRESIHPKGKPLSFAMYEKENKAPKFPVIPERVSSRKHRRNEFATSSKDDTGVSPIKPHGFVNKKRRREVSSGAEPETYEPSPKKQKATSAVIAPSILTEKSAPLSRIPSPVKKKGGLSLSRLNMLARPKMRK